MPIKVDLRLLEMHLFRVKAHIVPVSDLKHFIEGMMVRNPHYLGDAPVSSKSLQWKMSWESLTPKGNRLKQYHLKGC